MEGTDSDDPSAARPDGSRGGEGTLPAAVAAAADALGTVGDAELRSPPGVAVPERLSSVLVGVAGGPHSGATVDLADRLAADRDAWLDLFHVATDAAAPGERYLETATARIGRSDSVDTWLAEGRVPAHEIADQSAYYDVVVVGAPAGGRLDRLVYGSTTGLVSDEAAAPVIVVSAADDSSLLGPTGSDPDPDPDPDPGPDPDQPPNG